MRGLLLGVFLAVLVGAAAYAFWPRYYPGRTKPAASSTRIVSLAPSLTEMAIALGAESRLVGVTDFCQDVDEKLPRVGGLQIDVERIVHAKPDLVLAIETSSQARTLRALRKLGIQVEVLPAESVADIKMWVLQLGTWFDVTEAAAGYVAKLDEVLGAKPVAADAPRVLFVVDWKPLYVAGAGSFVDELLAAAGARNAYADQQQSYVPADVEHVVARDPDVIIDASLTGNGVEGWKRFPQLKAVREGRVYAFEPVTPSLRCPEWVAKLRELLHSKP